MSELSVIEIKADQAPALFVPGGLDAFLEQIRSEVNEVPDLATAKGRARIASLSAQVSRSKTAIEKPGREYLKRLKEAVKPAEAEIKRFVDACDALRDETRRPLTEWEAEQERIKAVEAMNAMHAEALEMNEEINRQRAAKFDADHELALQMNEIHDRDVKARAEEAERQRMAHEEEIKRQAAAKAVREAAEAAQREIDEAAAREREAILAKERAEREAKETAEKAEREKQEAIAAEQRKAQEEVERVRREAQVAETARIAEQNRIAAEESARAADVEHRRTINRKAVADLVANGIPQEMAETVLKAIVCNKISCVSIKY